MSVPGIIGLLFVLIFLGVLLYYGIARRKQPAPTLRSIPAFQRIQRAIGLSVEDGTRLHFSLGRGDITSAVSAIAFVGLSMLERVTRIIAISDRLPVVTSGDGSVTVLSQDTLQSTYREMGEEAQYDPWAARLTGPTPFSYAAGTIPLIQDEQVSTNLLAGHLGNEVAFLTEAAERAGGLTLAATDSLDGQAVLFVASDEPLVGEEAFAGGAYLQAGPMHIASLRAQDVFRWVIVALIVLGALLNLFGFGGLIASLFVGGS